jgi:hypothetical protein
LNDEDFTDAFCKFLQAHVTSVDAAELLLALWRKPTVSWSIKDLADQVHPVDSLSEAEAAPYVEAFHAQGLVARTDDGRFRQALKDLDVHMQTLARLYLDRPVTLFRVIHALRDPTIQKFADAFRIWGK